MTVNETIEHIEEVEKFTTLYMKDNNSEDNRNVKKSFIAFAWEESNGNYFQAMKRLLENYSADYKYASLFEAIQGIKANVAMLESSLQTPVEEKKEEPKFFN